MFGKAFIGRLLSLLFLAGILAPSVYAFSSETHQMLTFIAAREFNNCAHAEASVTRFSALDTRYIVRANAAQADTNFFTRMFNWNYYNRADQRPRTAFGVIDTRFHDHFDDLVDDTQSTVDRQRRLKNLGKIISYIQDMSSPARVVPVYVSRWWRFSVGDRFDRFAIDSEAIEDAVAGRCNEIADIEGSFQEVLDDVAAQTIKAVRGPIFGFPSTWEAYWRFSKQDDDFGEYGPAGNSFGDRTSFRCGDGKRCLLLKNDPLYRDFATARHISAVLGSMRAMALMEEAEKSRVSTQTAR
ncbi:MAG: hypothetical protein GKR90_23685 [Pseudomonadales bacterium]|nr:hypothetical protein [Pseudomonadales bacterium]